MTAGMGRPGRAWFIRFRDGVCLVGRATKADSVMR
jgi:hypothetical protein